jgi:hypothetical protein
MVPGLSRGESLPTSIPMSGGCANNVRLEEDYFANSSQPCPPQQPKASWSERYLALLPVYYREEPEQIENLPGRANPDVPLA